MLATCWTVDFLIDRLICWWHDKTVCCPVWHRSEGGSRYCHSEYSTDFDDASSTLSSPREWEDPEDGRSCRKPKQLHCGIHGSRRGGGQADRWNDEPSLYDRSLKMTSTGYDFCLLYWSYITFVKINDDPALVCINDDFEMWIFEWAGTKMKKKHVYTKNVLVMLIY